MAKLGKILLIVLVILAVLITVAVIGARNVASTPDEVGLVPGADNVYLASNKMVRVFLIDVGDSAVLIDAGVDNTGNILQALVESADKSLEDITDVFITHGHNDHFVGLIGLPHIDAVNTYIGAEDADFMNGTIRKNNLAGLVLNNAFPAHYFEPTDLIRENTTYTLADGSELHAIHLPGHTPGSYLFFYDGVLFIGDAFNYDAAADQLAYPPDPVTADMPQTIKSISQLDEALEGLNVVTICTSHGGCTPPDKTAQQLRDFIARAKRDS